MVEEERIERARQAVLHLDVLAPVPAVAVVQLLHLDAVGVEEAVVGGGALAARSLSTPVRYSSSRPSRHPS